MLADMRDALRQLRKAPGFALTAIITLALGIGATTAIFTLVHQVMLKSLPVVKPQELWRIGDKIRCCNWGGYVQGGDGNFSLFSWEMYKHFRAHTPEFSDLAALQAGNAPLGVRRAGSQAAADTRNGQYVSGNFFRTLGINPWIGRIMTDADDQLSHLERKVRRRSHRGGRGLSDQRASLHRDWRRASRLLWCAAWRQQHARLLASFDLGTHPRWTDRTPQTARRKLSRPAGPCAAGGKSDPARSQTQSGIPRLAGRPRARYAAGREAALATRHAAPYAGRRWGRGDARSVSGWAEATVSGCRLCAAGGLRQPGQPDAGAGAERSRTDIDTNGPG